MNSTLIDRYFRPLTAGSPGALDLADDAALLDVPEGRRLVVSADALVAGVHFFPEDAPDLIARKMLRVNLSDLAAMAAVPLGYVMTCAFPKTVNESWLAGFAAGLARDQMEFAIKLLGGDTVVDARAADAVGHDLRHRRSRQGTAPLRRQGRRSDRGQRHHRRFSPRSTRASRARSVPSSAMRN